MNEYTQRELKELNKLANEDKQISNVVNRYLDILATKEGYVKTADNTVIKGGINWDE